MNPLALLKSRFAEALGTMVDDPADLLGMIRPASDPKFGDYQANCAMPLGKRLQTSPREVADKLVAAMKLDDLCSNVEVAGPGFINLKLSDDWLLSRLTAAVTDARLAIEPASSPRTVVVDYSSPNVAKPMHVGHIRSTVIGDAIAKTLRFVGHQVITDNHLGDWGTQFGMIIYGYKHFRDDNAYQQSPVTELGRLYKLVRQLIDYHAATLKLPQLREQLAAASQDLEQLESASVEDDKAAKKAHRKRVDSQRRKIQDLQQTLEETQAKVEQTQSDPERSSLAAAHPDIGKSVLEETAKLHEGDPTNRQLWEEFLPHCREDIQRIYRRLGIHFDHELGESFYHDQLEPVVQDLEAKGFTKVSEGAVCVFVDGFDTPMIVQKRDGAFLYATTDLATIAYRAREWNADASLYVVDHRQSEHFEKLFAVAHRWGYQEMELRHVSFGTVLGTDKKPFKTRSGDTVGLEGLLDEAEQRALAIAQEINPDLDRESLENISRVVGLGGIKYADLSHNRSSDYVFDYDKMLALKGNTSTFVQYGYARVQGILRKTGVDPESLRNSAKPFLLETPVERQLGVKLARLAEAIDEVLVDYKPHLLCAYLFELTQLFFQFFDQCSVKDADSEELRTSRLQLCDLTARTIKQGLALLGIEVLDQM